MIIDAHAHIFPDKIADKVAHSICNFYGFYADEPDTIVSASVQKLLEQGKEANISHYLVSSVAVTEQQTTHINDFLLETSASHPQFTPLCALHPDYADYETELDRAVAGGMRGVKLHPDFQRFNMDEERYLPFFRAIAKRNLPILMHMGDARYDFSSPERLGRLMRAVPDLVVTAAHFGGYSRWEEVVKHLEKSDRLYFDTCSSLGFLSNESAMRLIDHYGADKFLFGTDFPIWNASQEIEKIHALGLSEAEEAMIFAKNFCKLYKLDKLLLEN